MAMSKEDRGLNWSFEETMTLINIWSDSQIQEEFERSRRNATIFEKLAKKMTDAGYDRNMGQCRTKIKSLKADYYAVRKENNKSGKGRRSFPYYEALDKVLGHRPAAGPSNLIDTSASSENFEEIPSDNSDDDDDTSQQEENGGETDTPAIDKEPKGDPNLPKIELKRKRPYTNVKSDKKTKQEKLDVIMEKTVQSFITYQREAEERYEEREEKRRKEDRDREEREREKEREHELKLFAMLSGSFRPQQQAQESNGLNISGYEPYKYYDM